MTERKRYSFRLPEEDVEALDELVPNRSEFFRGVLEEAAEMEEEDDKETLRVRRRVLRMQRNVLDKEIRELERQRDKIDEVLEEDEKEQEDEDDDEPHRVLWETRLDDLLGDASKREYDNDKQDT